jgi:hypothetical protein
MGLLEDLQAFQERERSAWDASRSVMPEVRQQGARETLDNWSGVAGLLGSMKAPAKLFRGVGPTTGKNTATLGKGLYSTPDKSFAAQYGAVSEVPVAEAFPKNPLVIPGGGRGDAQGLFADWALEKSRLPNMREFNKRWPDPAEFVKSLGYDGVWIGSEIVKY